MKYDDELEDYGDLGQAVLILLSVRGFGVKDELWDLLQDALSRTAFEELKELVAHYWEERRET